MPVNQRHHPDSNGGTTHSRLQLCTTLDGHAMSAVGPWSDGVGRVSPPLMSNSLIRLLRLSESFLPRPVLPARSDVSRRSLDQARDAPITAERNAMI